MRTFEARSLALSSLAVLATLVGCGDSTPTPAPTPPPADATPDSPAPEDATVDTAAPSDGPAPDAAPSGDAASTDALPAVDSAPMGECGFIDPAVRQHVTAMQTMGWGALNRGRNMMMYGCAGATNAQGCLAMKPEASDGDIGGNRSAITGAHLRVLYSSMSRSNFWTRGSADGRFVGRGVYVYDLNRSAELRATGAMFDPAFFPDNSGFSYQPNGRMCPMSMLTTGMPTSVAITGSSSPCANSPVGLYQHLGTSLDGADYWATAAGAAAWDDGGHMPTLTETPQNMRWTASASMQLTLMANSGSGYTSVGQRSIRTPFQGDAVISPSSKLVIARFVDQSGAYQGYILNRLDATHEGAAITASVTEIARYCVQGAKPAFSYDERFVVYHHYLGGGPDADADARELGFSGADDMRFAEYASRGAANVYMLDLLTGRNTRITTMGPGQYALYPFFRNDGWIYFIVRTLGTTREHVIASDARLLAQ